MNTLLSCIWSLTGRITLSVLSRLKAWCVVKSARILASVVPNLFLCERIKDFRSKLKVSYLSNSLNRVVSIFFFMLPSASYRHQWYLICSFTINTYTYGTFLHFSNLIKKQNIKRQNSIVCWTLVVPKCKFN